MDGTPWHLHLLVGPHLQRGEQLSAIPEGGKRLLAYVALRRVPLPRRLAAAALWPDGDDPRAAGNLRSALWRLRAVGAGLLLDDRESLALDPAVIVDLYAAEEWSARLLDGCPQADDLQVKPWCRPALDLLPGWYDEWAILERERLRARMLAALEALAACLVARGQAPRAVEAALLAVSADPLRESAQRALLEAHLAEGNRALAQRAYRLYEAVLHRELGVGPSQEIVDVLYRHDWAPERRALRRPA